MTSYIPAVATITQTITDLGTIISAFGESLPGAILSLVIPFAMLGAIVGIIALVTKLPTDIIAKVFKKT